MGFFQLEKERKEWKTLWKHYETSFVSFNDAPMCGLISDSGT